MYRRLHCLKAHGHLPAVKLDLFTKLQATLPPKGLDTNKLQDSGADTPE